MTTKAAGRDWPASPQAALGLTHPPSWRLLAGLLAVDAALIAIHVVNRVTVDYRFLRIDIEFGAGELFQYGKLAAAAVVMVALARRAASLGPLLWAAVFAYLAVDDAVGLHERLGGAVAGALGGGSGTVQNQAVADLIVAAGVLGVAALATRWAVPARRPARVMVGCLLAFGLFAGVVDVAARLGGVLERRWLRGVFAVVEEGGELIVVTALVWLVLMVGRERSD